MGLMSTTDFPLSQRTLQFGDLQYRRAIGEAPEMECAKSTCALVSRVYSAGMRVVDVGCGAGHYLRSLRSRVDEQIDYLGVDANPHYIELAQRAFPEPERFAVVDGGRLPYPDESFDIALCINVIPNIPPAPDAFLADLMRIASRFVIVRALFAENNYIIADDWSPNDPLLDRADAVAVLGDTQFNNMYSAAYFREVIASACPGAVVDIEPDNNYGAIDNRPELGVGSTRTEDGRQISGPLVLDWRYLFITKP